MRPFAFAFALASLAAFTGLGCAAPDESEDVDSAAGAAVGSMPERTTLYGAGGLIAYFDGGWEKPNVTLYRGNAKQTLRCEAQPFRLDGITNEYRSEHAASAALRCFDTPGGATAAEHCQVIFTRKITMKYTDVVSYSDEFEASCWSADRTPAKQKAFLKFVLGDLPTVTVPNKERTEPTAEQAYAGGIKLDVKTTGKEVDTDPYSFSWTVVNAIREVARTTGISEVHVSAPGAALTISARDREYRPITTAKPVSLVEGGKVVAYPEMIKRVRAGFGFK